MSITITINNNYQWLKANRPDLIQLFETEDPADSYEIIPYELNLANGNFIDFFTCLGLANSQADYYGGSIKASQLIEALKGFDPKMLVHQGHADGNFIIPARSLSRVVNVYWGLSHIAHEALRRDEFIVWG